MHFPIFQITMTITEKMWAFFYVSNHSYNQKGKKQVLLADQIFGEIPAYGLGWAKEGT